MYSGYDTMLTKSISRHRSRLCAILCIISWVLVGCVLASDVGQSQERRPVRYLALGDSYTIGASVAPAERWPVQLAAQLRANGLIVAEPLIIARTGWTTDELMAGIERQQPQGPFDLVSLLIGVNDQYRGRSDDEYRRQLRQLLHTAIAYAGGHPMHVIVLSIPDWSVTPFAAGQQRSAIATAIDHFNAINRQETAQAGARYVDVTPVSRQALQDASLLATDGLHPSGKMYTQWVELVLPTALAATK
jgi:lysophospholipase L1-like esterase